MNDDLKFSSVHYNSYLQIDKITSAQSLRSVEVGLEAHDEMLFIITHQVYELWFKQLNYELKSIIRDFNSATVHEAMVGIAVSRMQRMKVIMDLLVKQIAVMETMTPLDFLDFRNFLFPASGFQSFQFRELEVLLGLKHSRRTTYNNKPYHVVFSEEKQEQLHHLEDEKSLFELIEGWLERIPFLEFGDYNFIEAYRKAVMQMLESERAAIRKTDILTEETKQQRLAMLGDTNTYFAGILDAAHHATLKEEGMVRLSYKATLAALFINLYRDEPILRNPFILLSSLVELDDQLTTWRYRHAQMVMRMLGRKMGTGGSSGHEYLATTAAKHQIFADFHQISTLLIPRSELPVLPAEFRKTLGFYFTQKETY